MHFYRFLSFFCQQITQITLIIHDLLFLSCCHRMNQMKLIYPSSYHSCHSMMALSPIQELEPGATPCRGGRCAAAILTDRSSRKQKYLDYDVVPADGVGPPQGLCRARDGVGLISLISIPRNSISDHAARCRVLHTSRAAPHKSLLSAHS